MDRDDIYDKNREDMELAREEYVDKNLTDIRREFEEYLVEECGYSRRGISEVWDGRDEYLEREKQIFITNYKNLGN